VSSAKPLSALWTPPVGAKLVIAKIDRLSRDAHFLLGLEKAGVDFVAADKAKPLYALWTSAALVALDTALRGLPSRHSAR
jgi:hypothetical protein